MEVDRVETVGLGHGHGRKIAFSYAAQCFGFFKKNTLIDYKFLLKLSIGMDFL